MASLLLLLGTMYRLNSFRRSFVFGALLVSLLLPRANAGLLTPGYETQLESWLGQGNMNFTNIFTKATGDDSYDFHAAVDNKGATFTLMSVFLDDFSNFIIGGFNPVSWNGALNNWVFSPTDSERTAFIYNLSTTTIQRQNLLGQGVANNGILQTYNQFSLGPTFGGGWDLGVSGDLNSGLANNASYGGTHQVADIVNGAVGGPAVIFNVVAFEVYTVAPGASSVPDAASTVGLMTVALAGLLALRRRASRV